MICELEPVTGMCARGASRPRGQQKNNSCPLWFLCQNATVRAHCDFTACLSWIAYNTTGQLRFWRLSFSSLPQVPSVLLAAPRGLIVGPLAPEIPIGALELTPPRWLSSVLMFHNWGAMGNGQLRRGGFGTA